MKTTYCFVAVILVMVCGEVPADAPRPNVLFIAVDDLNDWIGCLGGHPQVKTPNIDRLSQRGVIFSNAHCAAPLCNPSRAAVFSGRQPLETGVFANDEANIRKVVPDLVLIPQHFKAAGYRTLGTGKLLHSSSKGLFDDEFFPEQRWSPFDPKQVNYTDAELPSKGTPNPRHVTVLNGKDILLPLNRMPSDRAPDSAGGESFDWGAVDTDDAEMGDGQIAIWAAERLTKMQDKPFFLAVGFYRPHIPLFAPKKYFELYDGLDIHLPAIQPNDLDDLSPKAKERALEADTAGAHATVLQYDQWPAAVKSYLACVSFIDAQVGRVLDALDASPHASNTIIVLWGDHGWHLGEKQHWGKWSGWERATHVPLIVAAPRDRMDFARGVSSSEPVSLLDLYPTLIELGGLPSLYGLSGQSLVTLLKQPSQSTGRVVLTTFDKGNYSVTGSRWRYIRYEDGSEELYDRMNDPNEWTNLAANADYASQKALLAKSLPDEQSYPAPSARASGALKKKSKTKKE